MKSESAASNHEAEPQYLKEAAEIQLHMTRLLKAKAVLMVSVGGGKLYRSSLLHIDRAKGWLAIDEVLPLDGNALLQQAPALSLAAQSETGPSYWQLPAGMVRAGVLDDLPCHWLPLPQEVRYMQRRRSFRASFLIGQAPPLAILDEQGQIKAHGDMLDVSEHGCKLLLKLTDKSVLPTAPEPLWLRIEPAAQPAFEVVGEVRHITEMDRQAALLIGIRFEQVAPAISRQLAQLVLQVQRERRRQQLALGLD